MPAKIQPKLITTEVTCNLSQAEMRDLHTSFGLYFYRFHNSACAGNIRLLICNRELTLKETHRLLYETIPNTDPHELLIEPT